MALIGLALSLYICTLIVSMIGGFVRFLADIRKWKKAEEKVYISKKEFEHDLNSVPDVDSVQAAEVEKGVNDNAGNDEQCSSPIIF